MAGYDATVLATSPTVFFKFDETSGTTSVDSSGNGFNAQHVGGVTVGQPSLLAAGTGKSVLYGGSGYTDVSPAGNLNSGAISINLRIKVTAASLSGTQIIASRWVNSAAGLLWLLWLDNGKPTVRVLLGSTEYTTSAPTALAVDQTATIAATFDTATLRLFVDGAQANSLAAVGLLPSATTPFEIARASSATYGNLQLDGFAYWMRAITPTEVANIHTAAASTAVTLAIGQVVETDTARGPLTLGALPIGQVVETSVARSLVELPPISIGTAVESDVTRTFALPGAILIGTATETDVARAGITSPIAIGRAESYDTARPVEVAPAVTAPARPYGMSKVKALAYPTPDLIDGRVA